MAHREPLVYEPPRAIHQPPQARYHAYDNYGAVQDGMAETIANQKKTIERLAEEATYMNRALERFKDVDKSMY